MNGQKKGKPYCECFVPISIDKWFERIHIKPEMNVLLQQIYRDIGRLEGLNTLLNCEEVENINRLIGRINVMHCQTDEDQSLGVMHFFSGVYEDESVMEAYRSQIVLCSDINALRFQHREKFIILQNTIWALRKEFHPVSPERIGDCIDELLVAASKYTNSFRRHNEVMDPILFSGLLFYQLLTLAPYEKNNILYSACAVEKYMQKLQMLPEVTIPFAKFIQDNINECDDRMAGTRQACNMDQWLLFYLDILDKALNAACGFVEVQHRCMIKSMNVVNKLKNISVNMKDRMYKELGLMQQMPLFRIEDVMNHCGITHSTAAKMVNIFIGMKIVKQVDDKQRYCVYEYSPLMECIRKM
ncbi:MAG: hypothetical protein LUG83_02920 [Lachnospiraceae bacterium]|nr:hypothetical protein [Lachnospiraceae bacterium]